MKKLNTVVKVRVSETMAREFAAIVKRKGVTMSDVIRACIAQLISEGDKV